VSRTVKDVASLREARVDLEIGVLGKSGPELRTRSIYRDRFVGMVRAGHPLLASPVTPAAYAACQHVVASRKVISAMWHPRLDAESVHLCLREMFMAVCRDALEG
jgi:DNA-binding transcriptional LysR family regulator